jgi:pimeloyl-ACP methyl ester carboxylesterase/DNA-binding winged helix-turn-helix (wHTH) protein
VTKIIFPPFQIDSAAGRLLRGSQVIELAPKALSLLQYLAEREGQLVPKGELLSDLWPDVYVTEAVLKVTIGQVRKALGDSSREPRFIETAHRRGYRFIAKTAEPCSVTSRQATSAPVVQRTETVEAPETRYTRNGDVNIAYQVLGEGPVDIVFVMGWVSHLEYFWTEPRFARFLRRLSSLGRLILFDKRGTGLSDRVPLDRLPTLEQRMDDVRAVMDAAGSNRAVLCGVSEGGAMSALFAATYPEKTAGLVMIGSYAKRLRDATYPWGPTEAQREEFLEEIQEHWGGPIGLKERAPSLASDPDFSRWWATYLRMAASPAAAVALTRMNSQADIREILPTIRVPTLVIHRKDDACLLVEEGRFLASRIPGARFVELPGSDHLPFVGDQEAILDEIERFLQPAEQSETSGSVLATIVAASFRPPRGEPQVGSRVWQRLQDHVQREVRAFQGREFSPDRGVVLASFNGTARAIRCASSLAQHARTLGIEIKAGLHAGECGLGGRQIQGVAVEVARGIARQAALGEILVSATIRDLVAGSDIHFKDRGCVSLPPTDRPVEILAVESQ